MRTIRDGIRWNAGALWSALAYLLLSCLAYLPVLLHGQFLCDDFILLARIRQGQDIWVHHGADFFRPTISVALTAMWKLFGSNAIPYYVLNVLLLVGTGLLLRAIWLELDPASKKREGFERSAFAVGLSFVLWITHSESVSWISGITDTLSVFFGASALLAFLKYRRRPTWFGFAATLGLLWVGLLGKEGIVTWIPILLVFGFALFPSRQEWKLRIAETLVLLGSGVGFVVLRTHVIGQLIGGYGTKAHLNITWSGLVTKVSRHLANEFVPFNKLVALWYGNNWVAILTTISCGGAFVLLLRKWPRPKPSAKWVQISCGILILIGIIRLPIVALPDAYFEDYLTQMILAGSLLVVILAVSIWHWKVKLVFDKPWVFWGVSALSLMLHAHTIDKRWETLLLVVYCWFAFSTRPRGERTPEDQRLMKLGLVCFVATFLAIAPTATLRIALSGEASRFSYGPTFFSCITIACVILLYVKPVPIRYTVAVPALIASGILLYVNNVPWGRASEISGSTTQLIKSLLPARRIYVLSVPGTLNAAILLRIGIEHIAETALNNSKVEVHAAFYQVSTIDGDSVKVSPVDPITFSVSVKNNERTKRFEGSYLISAGDEMTEDWFEFLKLKASDPTASVVRLTNYNPKTDRIIVVDGQSARLIR